MKISKSLFLFCLWAAILMIVGVSSIQAQEDPLHTIPNPGAHMPAVPIPIVRNITVPNLVDLPTRCLAIITDTTVNGDAEAINAVTPNTTMLQDCNSWQDIDYRVACLCYQQEAYNGLILSGHGSILGGVKASNENLISSNISEAFLESLDTILAPEAPIFILGCSQGGHPEEMQAFADQTGHPVVANTSCVYGGNQGDGKWVTFYPFSWEWKRAWLTADLTVGGGLVQ